MHDLSDAGWALIQIAVHKRVAAVGRARRCGRHRRLAFHGSWVERQVLVDVVDGNVKAGMVGQVENVKAVLQRDPFSQCGYLHNGNVRPLLPGLAENVALPAVGDEIGLVRIASRNSAVQVPRLEDWYRKTGRL